MRRALGLVVVVALMTVSGVAVAGEYESYKDIFPDVTYSGSAGSIPWENPWYEIGDDGSPSSGDVHVWTDSGCKDYKCVHIEGYEGEPVNLGIKRYADLTMFVEAELCYDVSANIEGEKVQSTGRLDVQVTADGSKWTTLASYDIADLDGSKSHGQVDLHDFLSEGFGVRFVVNGVIEGAAFVDNVEIKGLVSSGTTTTTSTTTTSSTTTTTKPTTTTTKPQNTTTSTIPEETTTSTTSTTTTDPSSSTTDDTTTTTVAATTTTVPVAPAGPVGPPPDSGLRETDSGVQANFAPDLFGDTNMDHPEVMGVSIEANYSMAVEAISASWIWTLALLLLIVTAVVSGLDRRRSDKSSRSA